ACSVRLGREEGIEDLPRLRRQPRPGVTDGNQQLITFIALRGEGEIARVVNALHGVDAVDHQIHQDLLQLYAICHHGGEVCRERAPDGNTVSPCFVAQQRHDFVDDLVDIDQLTFRSTLLEQQARAADDLCCAVCVSDDPPGRVPRLL